MKKFGSGRVDQDTAAGKMGAAVGDAAATITGTLEAFHGAGTEAGGLALDETVALAPVGAVLKVEGVAEMAHGTVTAGEGLVHLVKAADAPGVSSSGQATDEHGNKLGGSGKPQQHSTESNTVEGARNKALKEGATAVEHPSPKEGKPHFRSGDAQGNKKPNSTHHNYPE